MITMKQSPTDYYKSKTDEMSVLLKIRKDKTKYFIAAEITLFLCFVAGAALLFLTVKKQYAGQSIYAVPFLPYVLFW